MDTVSGLVVRDGPFLEQCQGIPLKNNILVREWLDQIILEGEACQDTEHTHEKTKHQVVDSTSNLMLAYANIKGIGNPY